MNKTILFSYILIFYLTGFCKAQWIQTNGPPGGESFSIVTKGSIVIAGTYYGVFQSSNNGETWHQTKLLNKLVSSVDRSGIYTIAATVFEGIYVSSNDGLNWIHSAINNQSVNAVVSCDSLVYCGSDSGVYKSTDYGLTWVITSLNHKRVKAFAVSCPEIYALTDSSIYYSNNNGQNWSRSVPIPSYLYSLTQYTNSGIPYLFVGTLNGIYFSTNYGQNWSNTSFTGSCVNALIKSGTNILAGLDGCGGGIFASSDDGQNWIHVLSSDHLIRSFASQNANVYAATGNDVYKSTNNGLNWTATNMNGAQVYSMTISGQNLLAGTSTGAFFTSDNGNTWRPSLLNKYEPVIVAANGSTVLASVDVPGTLGVFRSTDFGQTWSTTSINNRVITTYLFDSSVVYGGNNVGGVYISSDNGQNWVQSSMNFGGISSIVKSGNHIYAGAFDYRYGVFLTTNNGQSWSQILNNQIILALTVSGANVFAGGFQGLFISNDSGANWTFSTLGNHWVSSLYSLNAGIVAGTDSGIYVSTNFGLNWIQRNDGIGIHHILSFQVFGDNLYAGTEGGSIWKIALSEILGIENSSNSFPQSYSLFQNYPNPFNPSTNIKFEVPLSKGGDRGLLINLSIYDILGREVATLIDKQLQPGSYSVNWDASNFPSGVYFYSLESGDFSESKKMILLK